VNPEGEAEAVQAPALRLVLRSVPDRLALQQYSC